MSMNLIAMLVSLAMMLTGAGGTVQPEAAQPAAQTARILTLSNINVTWNGETLHVAPEAHIGVSTDGTKALYDFAVELEDRKLLPVQLSADESGITALCGNGGVALKATTEALSGLAAQLEAQVNASATQAGGENAQMMQFITEQYMPAYTGMLKLAMDPDQRDRINTASQAVFDRVVDRGEGTKAVLEVDGEKYDVTAYSYSLDAMQIAALSDAVFKEIPELGDYYNALFKLYDMLPEESGLRGLDSYTALFERFGVQMNMDVEEQRTDDGAVVDMKNVLTIDLNQMMALPRTDAEATKALAGATREGKGRLVSAALEAANAVSEASEEAEGADAEPQVTLEPMVMNMHSLKLPDYSESSASCTYSIDGHHSADITMTATENAGVQELNATVFLSRDGQRTHGGKVSAFMVDDDMGTTSYSVSMKAIRQNRAKVDATFYGVENPDGTSENSVAVELRTRKRSAAISFDLNVTADAIKDEAGAAVPTCVLDDLSAEGWEKLLQDPALIGALMKAAGSMTADIGALKADPSVSALWALARGKGMPIDVDELNEPEEAIEIDLDDEPEGADEDYGLVIGDEGDYSLVVGDGDETAFDFDEGPVEDDGVLAFAEPKLNWLPSGWTVTAIETDTAYDWVQMNISDADGKECAYVIFFRDPEAETANYIVQENGKVVDGRMMNVTDFGEGGLSITVSENGMYGNLMFNSEAIELDTIGQIVAGIEF